MKTILVTGGAGFTGSNLVAALLERGTHRVVVCDMFGKDDRWRNLRKHHAHEVIHPYGLTQWMEDNHESLEIIYHLGGIDATTEMDVDLLLQQNFARSVELWRWCAKHNVRFIYNSSYAVYGGGENGFDDSLDLNYLKALKPMSGYGWTRLLFDIHVATVVANNEPCPPQWMGLRVFNSYGPNEYHREEDRSVICKTIPYAMQTGKISIFKSQNPDFNDGEQKRDMVFIKDSVKVLSWALDNPGASGIFNVGTGQARTFNEMADIIFDVINKPQNINYTDIPTELAPHYQYYTQAKIDRLRDAGYDEPFMSLEEGIRDFVTNYLTQDDQYR